MEQVMLTEFFNEGHFVRHIRCDVYGRAKATYQQISRSVLTGEQLAIAAACSALAQSLTELDMIILVDEATGYLEEQEINELRSSLQAYVHEKLRPLIKKFPEEFFQQIYRLYNWQDHLHIPSRVQYIGKLVNTWIYEQLSRDLLDAIQELHPFPERGYGLYKLAPLLSSPTGIPELDRLIAIFTLLMRVSEDKYDFEHNLLKAFTQTQQERQPLVVETRKSRVIQGIIAFPSSVDGQEDETE
jgi:P63C domain